MVLQRHSLESLRLARARVNPIHRFRYLSLSLYIYRVNPKRNPFLRVYQVLVFRMVLQLHSLESLARAQAALRTLARTLHAHGAALHSTSQMAQGTLAIASITPQLELPTPTSLRQVNRYTYTCLYACIHTHPHIYVCMYMCIYTYIYIHTHIYTFIYIYIYIYLYLYLYLSG